MVMAFLWRKSILCAVTAVTAIGVAAGPLDLQVVYPKEGQRLPAVDSTFIFGSVHPHASLSINGAAVDVHEDGGWLAFVPVRPGEFVFNVAAVRGGTVDTLSVAVNLPELPDYSYDSLYFRVGSFAPSRELWVMPGDEIPISFSGTPYCNAFALIQGFADTVYIREEPPLHYYRRATVFETDVGSRSHIGDTMFLRGTYTGQLTIPDTVCSRLAIVYQLYPPSLEQISWMLRHDIEHRGGALPYHMFGSLVPIRSDTLQVPVRIMDPDVVESVELTDSLTVIRTGPGRGYLCIHQPAGIRLRVTGKDDRWLRVRLSEYQQGWIPDTSAAFLPTGTVVPHSYIRLVQTMNHGDRVTVRVNTSARHPFRVEENTDDNTITVYIYGADSDTDWIRYDNTDSLIDRIEWFQPEPGVYGLKMYLTADRIWGYDGYYQDNEFRFTIKKFPSWKQDLGDFRYVIDPGHSPDPGATGPTGLTEKEANLAIARRLYGDLLRDGADAILTRRSNDSLALYDRPKIAVREEGDIFISIHNNALPDGVNPFVNNGISVFYYHPHSAELAHMVHNAMVRNLGLNDYDWYYGNLAVNRPTQYPAILVECAFMMIPEQEAMLRTESFQREISEAIIEGIKDFLRGGTMTEWDREQMESYDWR